MTNKIKEEGIFVMLLVAPIFFMVKNTIRYFWWMILPMACIGTFGVWLWMK